MAPRHNTRTNYGHGYSYNEYKNSSNRRFVSINQTIRLLKNELVLNDFVINTELEARISSVEDRELMAAELYKERLEALADSSRSQIWRVQTGNTPLINHDFSSDDSWNPKRMKFSNGYSHNRNVNYEGWAPKTYQNRNNFKSSRYAEPGNQKPKTNLAKNMKSKKITKPIVNLASKIKVPLKSTSETSKLIASARVTPVLTNSTKSAKESLIGTVNNTDVKISPAAKVSVFTTVPKIATSQEKTSKSVNIATFATSFARTASSVATSPTSVATTATNVATDRSTSTPVNVAAPVPHFNTTTVETQYWPSIKSETNMNERKLSGNVSSLSTCDLSNIKFEVKYENNLAIPVRQLDLPVHIKTEAISNDDMMVDDLADHL